MKRNDSIVLVYNPNSGSSLSLEELRRKFDDHNITIEQSVPIRNGLEKKLREPISSGKIIAVIGGDGTISAVAGLLVNSKATLFPLPGGTLNHFTKDLSINQDIDKAIANFHRGKIKRIDTGKVNDQFFINNSSIGLYPQALKTIDETSSGMGKWPLAIYGHTMAFVKLRTILVKIGNEEFRSPFVFVGNNDYNLNETLGITERKHLDKGQLCIYIAKADSRSALIKIAILAFIGQLGSNTENLNIMHTSNIIIKAKNNRPLKVSYDGEITTKKVPLKYSIQPKSLRVLV